MIYRYSNEQLRYSVVHKCRHCGKFAWKTDFRDWAGRPMPEYRVMAAQYSDVVGIVKDDAPTEDQVAGIRSVCRRCGADWPTFAVGARALARGGSRAAAAEDAPSAAADPARNEPATPARWRVVEHTRVTEPIGDELRVIDNALSPVATRRRIELQRQWTRTVEIGRDAGRTQGVEGKLSLASLGGLAARAERTVSDHYGIRAESVQTYTDEIEVTVNPKMRLEMVLHWNRIWQEGMLVSDDPDRPGELPFRVAVGLTFDQTIREAPD